MFNTKIKQNKTLSALIIRWETLEVTMILRLMAATILVIWFPPTPTVLVLATNQTRMTRVA